MKRFLPLILLFVVALSSAALATNPAAWWNTWALYFTNASTGAPETVTSSNPLPVSVISGGTGSSATVDSAGAGYVAPKGATSISGVFETISTSPSSWTLTASATDFAIWNLGTTTVWVDFNGTGATVSKCLPLTASGTVSRDAAQGVVVWLVASVPTHIYRAEGRR